ncbi:MAG TPA: YfiR family protein [Thermoanaerobaculia bacterium]|nr:YfiR family protein [Thermoanaerobaculia bacterium]
MALLRRTVLLALLALVPLVPAALLGQRAASPEYQVKAAFLYNFTKFVEWLDARPGERSPLRLCVLGNDPFGETLDGIVFGEMVGSRPLLPERVDAGEPLNSLRSCQVLFVSRSERARVREVLESLAETPVLTVSDLQGFLDAGGHIQFVMQGNKVRFAIDQAAAERSRLRISSKLLRLALSPSEVR